MPHIRIRPTALIIHENAVLLVASNKLFLPVAYRTRLSKTKTSPVAVATAFIADFEVIS